MSMFPTKILLATDGSQEATLAARAAADLACRTGSELHVVTVAGGRAHHVEEAREVIEQLRQGVEKVLDEQMRKIEEAGGAVDGTYVRVVKDRRDRSIVGLAEELGVGLIVLGSRGRGGAKRALLGSVSDSVVRLAPCPVMVVRGRDGGSSLPPQDVLLLAIDGSEEAGLALRTAVELANAAGSELHVVTVGREYRMVDGSPGEPEGFANAAAARTLEREAQGKLDEGVRKVEEAGGTVAKAHRAMGGRPDEKIVRLAEELNAALVVVGSRGLGGVRRALMGSVSDSVVRNAPCPVLVVRGERRREEGIEEEVGEKPSFWRRLFGPYPSPRQERVLDYVIHRISDGANLREVTQEEYVRRNASPDEVEQLLENPRLVEAARRALGEDFSAGKLDPK